MGTFFYRCQVHGNAMQGNVTVGSPPHSDRLADAFHHGFAVTLAHGNGYPGALANDGALRRQL